MFKMIQSLCIKSATGRRCSCHCVRACLCRMHASGTHESASAHAQCRHLGHVGPPARRGLKGGCVQLEPADSVSSVQRGRHAAKRTSPPKRRQIPASLKKQNQRRREGGRKAFKARNLSPFRCIVCFILAPN